MTNEKQNKKIKEILIEEGVKEIFDRVERRCK